MGKAQYLGKAIGFGGAGNLFLYPGNGDGSFGRIVSIPTSIPHINDFLGVDVNGDGLTDLVIAGVGEIDIFLNNGDGTFQLPIVLDAPGVTSVSTFKFLDLNRDGLLDILAADTILLRKKKP